jgi:hypothetical protein
VIERKNDAQLLAEKDAMDTIINSLMKEHKNLEVDKKKKTTTKKVLIALYLKRLKVDQPMHSEIENLLMQFNKSTAAYHGGKLNGMHFCRVMQQDQLVFQEIQQ